MIWGGPGNAEPGREDRKRKKKGGGVWLNPERGEPTGNLAWGVSLSAWFLFLLYHFYVEISIPFRKHIVGAWKARS